MNVPIDYSKINIKQVCNICGIEKPLSEFYKRSSNTCGYTKKCKDCLDTERKTDTTEQECGVCHKTKTLDNFHKSRFSKSGYSSWCKECVKNKNAEYYKRNAKENTDEVILEKDKNKQFKRCSDCKEKKSISEFSINRYNKDGHWSFCKECEQLRNKKDYQDYLSLPKEQYQENRERRNKMAKMSNNEAVFICYSHYCNGNIKCANPYHKHDGNPETDIDVLTIDHINSDGYKEVYPNGQRIGGAALARKLIKLEFPEGYQILCMSCNWKKRKVNKEFLSGKVGIGEKQKMFRPKEELEGMVKFNQERPWIKLQPVKEGV